MALIGKIRNNSWLLIILIGLGLGGFIIMDMFNSQTGAFGAGNQTTMGVVDGNKIDYNNFSRTEQTLYSNAGSDVYGRRDYLWNYFVEEALLKDAANELGLGVSRDELRELQFSADPKRMSEIIKARFSNPATRQVDRQQLNNIQQSLDKGELGKSPLGPYWAMQEKEVIKERLQGKMVNMVSKAMYAPTWLIEMKHYEQNNKFDLAYVQIPFDEISDLDIEVKDSDMSNYLSKNKNKYVKDEEARRMAFTVFEVKPTAADSAALLKEMEDMIPKFRDAENDTSFVENNYGSLDAAYVKKTQLNPDIANQIFDAEPGTVVGPFIASGSYQLAKLIGRKIVPDSVRSRHILLRAENPQQLLTARNRADSLKQLIENGTHSFDSLARAFGTDATASGGGDLGYAAPGRMVKPFEDLIFYNAEEGDLNIIQTQFGIHLVEVTGRKITEEEPGVRVAYVRKSIIPSEETENKVNNEALKFVAAHRTVEDLTNAVAANENLTLYTSEPLKRNDFNVPELGFGEETRRIVRWLYKNDEVNKVSPEVYVYQDPIEYFESKFVIAALKSVQPANNVKVEDVRDEIEPMVKNQKKGEAIIARINSQDLSAVASEFSVQVDTFTEMFLGIRASRDIGSDLKVVSTAYYLNEGEVSKPIIGEKGVYVVKVLNKKDNPVPDNIAKMRSVHSLELRSPVQPRLMDAIKREASITDNRSKFY
ncbi:MAG: peptidylprolyl isomerase [Bacteroidota bacterium]